MAFPLVLMKGCMENPQITEHTGRGVDFLRTQEAPAELRAANRREGTVVSPNVLRRREPEGWKRERSGDEMQLVPREGKKDFEHHPS